LIKAFRILDIDKSGSIDTAEFIEIFTNLHESFSKEEIEKMVKLADTNKDGNINQEEFIELMHHKREKFKGEDILIQLKQ
jgi:Ca2+-binding EF-hand superfamily protein